jgi:hypothetical protein
MAGSSAREARTSTSMVIIALVVALGVVGAITVTIVIIQIAEARGCSGTNPALNRSQGRCFHP